MTQKNLSMTEQQIHGHEEQTCGCQEGEVETAWQGMGLADESFYRQDGLNNKVYYAQNYIQYLYDEP